VTLADNALLDVFLRGERDYVQGTQMIARLAERLGPGNWVLDQAQFARITLHGLAIGETENAPETGGPPEVARIRFTDGGAGRQEFRLTEAAGLAPRRDQPLPVSVSRTGDLPAGGDCPVPARWTYQGAQNIEGMANVVVQAIRAEHGLRWPGSRNIWLTGCRRLHLPVAGGHLATGHLLISLYRRLGTTGQNQTVWNVDLPDTGLSGMVTFAFQFPEVPDGA